MEYLIPAFLVLLIVAGFVLFLVMHATERGGASDRTAADDTSSTPGVGADSRTPLGDTDQLADVDSGTAAEAGRFQRDDTGVASESEQLADRPF